MQVNTLLHVAGPEAIRIYNTFEYNEEEDREDVNTLLNKFDEHFLPQKNLSYERHIFHTRMQQPGETIDEFVTDLKRKAATCDFGELQDSFVKDRIIMGSKMFHSNKTTVESNEICYNEQSMYCRSAEVTNTQAGKLNQC